MAPFGAVLITGSVKPPTCRLKGRVPALGTESLPPVADGTAQSAGVCPCPAHRGRPKRWVVVRPPGAQTGRLLTRADGQNQTAAIGNQVAGRVGFFLRVDNFNAAYKHMTRRRVHHLAAHRTLRARRLFPRHRRQPMGPTRACLPTGPQAVEQVKRKVPDVAAVAEMMSADWSETKSNRPR